MPRTLKLKVDENNHVVVKDGMPVFIYEDGRESPFDVNAAMQKITDLNKESETHRLSRNQVAVCPSRVSALA